MLSSRLLLGDRLGVDGAGGDAHDLSGGAGVRAVGGEHVELDLLALHLLEVVLGRLDAAHLLHAVHLVADNLAPVGTVLVGLHHGHVAGFVVEQAQAVATPLVVDHRHAAVLQLVAGDHHAERRQRGGVVLDDHAVVAAEHGAVLHVPPLDRVPGGEVLVKDAEGSGGARLVHAAAVVILGHVRGEPEVVVVVLVLVRKGHDGAPADVLLVRGGGIVEVDLALVGEHDGGVQADVAALAVVDGAHLEALGVSADEARLAATVAGGAGGHHAGLGEDAGAAVVTAGEGDGVLVVVREVEVRGEPALDLGALAHRLDEELGRALVVVVEPAAPVDDVALLEDAEAGADDGRVREAEDLPAVLEGVLLDGLHEPVELLLVDGHLVRGVLRVAELRGPEADDESLGGDLVAELRGLLAHVLEVRLEVLGVGGELVDALEVVVAADDVVLVAEAVEELAHHLEAVGGAGEELLGLVDVLGLAEVAEGDEEGVGRLVEDLLDVIAALVRVLGVARVHVEVAEDGEGVVGGVAGGDGQAGGGGGGLDPHGRGASRAKGGLRVERLGVTAEVVLGRDLRGGGGAGHGERGHCVV
mmetsp:Transcript_13471/g.52928  ORF Transcript_13471/g.52928 Transcript_13471/m.52928 type:complete len:586 (+) Transcript_13471:1619-3376(+)